MVPPELKKAVNLVAKTGLNVRAEPYRQADVWVLIVDNGEKYVALYYPWDGALKDFKRWTLPRIKELLT